MSRFQFFLNTSTIRSEDRTVLDALDTAADAEYDGLELWVEEIDRWVAGGGALQEIKDRADSRGVHIVNLIAFPEWAVPEDDRRAEGIREAERCLKMAQALGCFFLAAPPMGIHDRRVDLFPVAQRYAAPVDLAADYGVTPLLEFWGIAQTLGTTGEALLVAAECGRPGVRILADIYHIYKGSGHHYGLEHIGIGRLGLVHVNDYPGNPGRDSVTDADRVYPGDGLAPWDQIVASLNAIEYEGMLSLELFNQSYWDQDPQVTAREGLEKLKNCVLSRL